MNFSVFLSFSLSHFAVQCTTESGVPGAVKSQQQCVHSTLPHCIIYIKTVSISISMIAYLPLLLSSPSFHFRKRKFVRLCAKLIFTIERHHFVGWCCSGVSLAFDVAVPFFLPKQQHQHRGQFDKRERDREREREKGGARA